MTSKKICIFLLSLLVVFFVANTSHAQLLSDNSKGTMNQNANIIRVSAGLGGSSIGSIVASIIQTILSLLAIIFLALTIFSGFQWMTAAGNEAKVEKAQDTIKAAVIGLVVILAAYAITYFIFNYLPFTSAGSSANIKTGVTSNQ